MNVGQALDLDGQIVVLLQPCGHVAAHRAAKFLGAVAAEDVPEEVLLRRRLQELLDAVAEQVDELLRVLLLADPCPLSKVVLQCKSKRSWLRGLLVGHLEVAEELLQLPQEVVINHLALVLDQALRRLVHGPQQLVAELRHHKELLQHADHVADAAEIHYAAVRVNAATR